MTELFTQVNLFLEGTALVALTASLIWGALSVLLSPCHLAGIPLLVAYIGDQGRLGFKRAFVLATLFSVGILITIALIGLITAGLGRIAGDLGGWINYLIAAVFFVVGLHLLDVLPSPWSAPGAVKLKKKGGLGAFLLGLVFGLALGPCTFAYMAPVIGVALKASKNDMLLSFFLMLCYGVGHCGVIILAGTFAELVQNYLNWNEGSKGAFVLRKLCGVLVLLGGCYMIYTAP